MSESALLCAVRDHLRSQLGYNETECDVEPDEEFPAITGNKYIAVMPGGWAVGDSGGRRGVGLDEVFGVDILVVIMAKAVPQDRRRNIMLDNLTGLNKRCRDIIVQVHDNWTMLAAANTFLTDNGEKGFTEALRFAGGDARPRIFDGISFGKQQTAAAGLGRMISFAGGRRIQVAGAIA
tara:strand:- start:11693 stop:12229 length:537 start_codon:yes stop_codon:yes gene_type:complete